MHLARHSITSTPPIQVLDARFDAEAEIFTTSTSTGFAVYRSWPLKLLRKRELTGGTLAAAVPLHVSSLLFLIGGGSSPLYPLNKVILWDDDLGREVAELEFKERVFGIACRRDWLVVSLRRRAVVFKVGQQVTRFREWDTCDNERGLVALSSDSHSTLLAIAGRQIGHVQLIHLPPCRPRTPKALPCDETTSANSSKASKHPVAFIAAHTNSLTALSVVRSGRLLATTSTRGTLLRVWDSYTGKLIREFRRGTDKAEIYGISFRSDEQEICVWSDKGTVHVFSLFGSSNRHSTLLPLSPFISLPKYFESEWSYAQYRIPSQTSHLSLTVPSKVFDLAHDEKCTVTWIQVSHDSSASDAQYAGTKYQLIVLTFSGCWYRLALPQLLTKVDKPSTTVSLRSSAIFLPSSISGSSIAVSKRRPNKGKERKNEVLSYECTLQEFRRFGRWDGWG